MKYSLAVAIGIAALLAVVVVALLQNQSKDLAPMANPTPSFAPSPTSMDISNDPTPSPSPTPGIIGSGGGVETGTISGKLCYPSQFLPAGSIEAKSTINQTVVSEYYVGSEEGGLTTYSLAVPEGTYIMRYLAGDLSGYHTNVCPTGMETSCAQDNRRQHIEIEVEAGEEVSGVDLCDFYYSEQTNPGF